MQRWVIHSSNSSLCISHWVSVQPLCPTLANKFWTAGGRGLCGHRHTIFAHSVTARRAKSRRNETQHPIAKRKVFICPPLLFLSTSCLHLQLSLSSPFRSKRRTPPQTPQAAPLPPPPLTPRPLSPSLPRCCVQLLLQHPRASSVSRLLFRRARFRTELPTTTPHLRSSGPQWPPPPPPPGVSGVLLPPRPPLQSRCLHHWSGLKWSSPTHTDRHAEVGVDTDTHKKHTNTKLLFLHPGTTSSNDTLRSPVWHQWSLVTWSSFTVLTNTYLQHSLTHTQS